MRAHEVIRHDYSPRPEGFGRCFQGRYLHHPRDYFVAEYAASTAGMAADSVGLYSRSSGPRRSAGAMSPGRPAFSEQHSYGSTMLAGYATLFGVEMTNSSGRRIRFEPGCQILFAPQVPVLMNHDHAREVATTGDSSAKVGVDEHGLYALFFPRNSVRLSNLVGDLVGRVRRGELGMSCEYQACDYDRSGSVLSINSARVNEITLTESPACRGTRVVVADGRLGVWRTLGLALREDRPFHKH